jgi:trehalose synthase-fused probable maltokinase
MNDRVQIAADEIRECLDEESLRDWVAEQRWYASKSRSVTGIEIVEGIPLAEKLYLALVQTRFATGTHELYQLPLTLRQRDGDDAQDGNHARADAEALAQTPNWTVFDALVEPAELVELVARMEVGSRIEAGEGNFSFQRVDDAEEISRSAEVRPIGVEQSNSSLVIGDRLMLKVFRKLEPGINPELEMLHFLTAHRFPHIASLHGWYEYDGTALNATLGVAQHFLPSAEDGWALTQREIAQDPEQLLVRLSGLGAVTAQMHTVLASDNSDPDFAPEEPSQEALSLLTATVDEDIERMFLRLPDTEVLAPIAGRGQDVRERLAARAQLGIGGRVIRTHGDYHLGQTLHTPRGWVIIDFEGEPARPLPERRQKRSPLRDVAGMLRSFAYATSALEIQTGQAAPGDFEARARDAFLDQYFAHIDMSLLPSGEAAIMNLLSIFELEKAIYELGYELDNRPDWVSIPVAGISRLLESV